MASTVSPGSRWLLLVQRTVFIVLVLAIAGLLGWLGNQYSYEADWTANNRHTLSAASAGLLAQLTDPVGITAYARTDEALRQSITALIKRYQQVKPDVTLTFVNPDTVPDVVRKLGISVDGELLIDYQGRQEHLTQLSEQTLTNALQRLARSGDRWLSFLTGHGERAPDGKANHDLRTWAAQLDSHGLKVRTVTLLNDEGIPDDTSVLVIAGPRTTLLPAELHRLLDYIDAGGNLLWLADTDEPDSLLPLAVQLGITLRPGIVIDPGTQLFGIDDVGITMVNQYPVHRITGGFQYLTLFPRARGIALLPAQDDDGNDWQGLPVLQSGDQTWLETGDLDDAIAFDPEQDSPGPITIGLALTRPVPVDDTLPSGATGTDDAGTTSNATQRVVIIGDGDFLSNAWLGNGGNLDLGYRLINWLASDDAFIDIPTRLATDRQLELSGAATIGIALAFLVIIPLLLLLTGALIWWQRRKA